MLGAESKPEEALNSPSNGRDVEHKHDVEGNSTTSSGDIGGAKEKTISDLPVEGKKVVKKRRRIPGWAFKMLYLIKDITIMILVAVTYAALSNE